MALAHPGFALALTSSALAFITLKFIAAITTPLWVYRHGATYMANLQQGNPLEDQGPEYWKLLDNSNGKIFPFGIRGYRLLRYHDDTRGKRLPVRLSGDAVLLLHRTFSLVGVAIMVVALLIAASPDGRLPDELRWMGLAICIEIVLWPMLIAIEAALAYSIMGSYGIAYYRPDNYYEENGPRPIFTELLWYAFTVVVSFTYDIAAAIFLSVNWDAFAKLAYGTSLTDQVERAGAACYYMLINLLGTGDAAPANAIGRLFTVIVFLQGVVYFVMVLAVLLSSPSAAGTTPGPEPNMRAVSEHYPLAASSESNSSKKLTGALAIAGLIGLICATWSILRRHRIS